MKNRRVSLRIVVVVTCSLLSCTRNDPERFFPNIEISALTKYFPLEVGAQWIYKSSLKGLAHHPKRIHTILSLNELGYRVRCDSVWDEHGIAHNVLKEIVYYRPRKEGVEILDDSGRHEGFMLRTPYSVGTSWEMSIGADSLEMRYTILDTAAKAEVPGGTFDKCLLVECIPMGKLGALSPGDDSILRFAPHVGLVSYQNSKYVLSFYSIR